MAPTVDPIGRKGEEMAIAYLRKKGYVVLHRNYRTPVGEADIIARDHETIVFVEVKTRSGDTFGQPFEAVNDQKQDRIRRVALYFLKQHAGEPSIRFDVVSIFHRDGHNEIRHIIEAF